MLPRIPLLCVLVAAVACSPSSQPPPASGSPPDTDGTTVPAEATVSSVVEGPIRGALPDGTIYDVILEPRTHEEVAGVTAGVLIESAEEAVEMSFLRDDDHPTGWSGDTYRIREDPWTLELRLPPSALDELGADGRRRVEESLQLSTHLGLPVLELSPPLNWAEDDLVAHQVIYETFAVRRGCPRPAVACNPTRAVGVIPLQEISPDAPAFSAEEAEVVSYSLRPPTDPHHYDPGPLSGRSGHDLLWTGDEMIVWGGTGPRRMDGAAFDPDTGQWRLLSSGPWAGEQATRAVWADDRMIVISVEATVAYDPGDDTWARLGPGLEPPAEAERTAWTGTQVVIWDDDAVHVFRPDGDGWRELPSPGSPGAFRAGDERLYAVGGQACPDRLVSEWTGQGWRGVAAAPATEEGCPSPEQTAVVEDRFLMWRDDGHPTWLYEPSEDRWIETAPIPLPSVDRPSGPLEMGDRLLVPGHQQGAVFDPADNSWTRVELPGHGRADTTVWTGSEVLMWDRCCYEPDDVDAWRWAPPD